MHLKEESHTPDLSQAQAAGIAVATELGLAARPRQPRNCVLCLRRAVDHRNQQQYSAVSGCPELAGLQQQIRRLDAVRTRRPAADCPESVSDRPILDFLRGRVLAGRG